jgi:hypothetical protein
MLLVIAIFIFVPFGFLGATGNTMDADLKAASKFAMHISSDSKPKGRCACREAADDTANNAMGVLRYQLHAPGGKTRIGMECWVPEYAFGEVIAQNLCSDWVPLAK